MNFKNNRGSITLFVIVQVIFMTSFLVISYSNILNKSKVAYEQKEIISGTYSYGDSDGEAYNRAYKELRDKNKQLISVDTGKDSYPTNLELDRTYGEKLENYQIYGRSSKVGTWNDSKEKYEIKIKVSDKSGANKTYNIYLDNPLSYDEYIDFKGQKLVKSNGTQISAVLPEIIIYEDYTKIEIIDSGIPSRIIVNYVGFEL